MMMEELGGGKPTMLKNRLKSLWEWNETMVHISCTFMFLCGTLQILSDSLLIDFVLRLRRNGKNLVRCQKKLSSAFFPEISKTPFVPAKAMVNSFKFSTNISRLFWKHFSTFF